VIRDRVRSYCSEYCWAYDIARATRNAIRGWGTSIGRQISGRDKREIRRYLDHNEVRKLQLGSGYHPIGGWLNSDYLPQSSDVIRLDATGVYPFGDETFDYVFSEHMIEHVAYEKGQRMLRECFRILKVGGTIRISTPDLAFLIALYSDDKTELQCQYIRWSTNKFIGYAPKQEDTYVINNFVRDLGALVYL